MQALELLKDPLYRKYWLTLALSQMGNWMQNASIGWLVITYTGSAELLGIVVAMQFLPFLLFSLPAGVMADTLPRRQIIFYSQTILMLLSAVMGLLIWRDWVNYPIILLYALATGTGNAFDLPARQAFVVELATKARYPGAISLNSFAFNFSRLGGPALAGLLIAYYGLMWSFLINALTFLPVLWVVYILPQGRSASVQTKGKGWQQMKEGISFAWQNPLIRQLLLGLTWIGILGMNFSTLIPAYARLVMGLEADGYGFLMSMFGLGALLGSIQQALLSQALPRRILWGVFLLGIFQALLYFDWPQTVIIILWAGCGYAMVTALITMNTVVQSLLPEDLRGRVMSVYFFILLGTGPLGAWLAGSLFEWLDGQVAMGFMGLCALLGLGFFLYRPLPQTLDVLAPAATILPARATGTEELETVS